MNKQDAIKFLKSIQQWVPDCDDREDGLSYWDAIDMAIDALDQPNEPITQADLDKMHFDRVWIDYGVRDDGEREGEDGVVLYGKLYSIDTLDGSAFEDLLIDATGHGDTLDNPSGNYTVYRRPPEGEADE